MSAAPAAETRPDMLKAALWYSEHGFAVFPVHSAAGGRCSCRDRNVNIPVSIPEPRTDSRMPPPTRTP
jgi:hypothetical protein